MKRTRVYLSLLIIAVLIFFVSLIFLGRWIHAPLSLEEPVRIKIKPGMSGRQIGHLLKENGVIESVEAFRWAIWLQGAEQDLKRGTVHLAPPLTRYELIEYLRSKTPLLVRVRLQEGWPSWRIFHELSERLGLSSSRLRALFSDSEFIASLGLKVDNLEGFLFPDTYNISVDASEKDVLRQLVFRFKDTARGLKLKQKTRDVDLTLLEAVTLASIIEREARLAEEKSKISAVLHNRLEINMPFQADPTVLFAYRNFSRLLSRDDLNIDSPYNTYLYAGIPPGPICSPGRGSLRAAVEPANSDVLYFVARGDGSHSFSRTYREHLAAVWKYRR
ncbi:MAG: endolytic transglycosylase MltG [bacterium]